MLALAERLAILIILILSPFQNLSLTILPLSIFLIGFAQSKLYRKVSSNKTALAHISLFALVPVLPLLFIESQYFAAKFIYPIGNFLNLLAIALNSGKMPIDQKAISRIEEETGCSPDFSKYPLHYSTANAKARFSFLDDRIVLKRSIVSLGDLVIWISVMITLVQCII